ncbi:MAG: twin-arginine translocase TatA/TatE family subunit [Planctomycetes bacterium]|nr:twin-arginine translocase TatA/TatE family subunit [Planctomycetota bacterium]
MFDSVGQLAYFLPGGQEWLVLLVVGLLLFGRNLPDVGRAVGKTVMELRRGLDQFKREIDRDSSMRNARDSFRDAKTSLRDLRDTMRLRDADLRRQITATIQPDPKPDASAPAGGDTRGVFDDLTDPDRSVAPQSQDADRAADDGAQAYPGAPPPGTIEAGVADPAGADDTSRNDA